MKKLILALGFLSGQLLFAHNVFPLNNLIYLSQMGPIGNDVIIQHFPNEDCIVTASLAVVAQPKSGTLVSVQASGSTTGLDVYFFVSAVRAPVGDSESVQLTGVWQATGINTAGQMEMGCDGGGPVNGLINMTVGVFANKPPTAPTVSTVFNPAIYIDPVSAATGELSGFDEQPDLDLGGPLDLSFRRYYASLLSTSGGNSALGPNWTHNFDVSLAILGNAVNVTLFRGKTVSFTVSGGSWQLSSTEQRPYQLVSVGTGYQFMSPVSNLIYSFDSSGALTAIADRNGNTLTITQAAGGVGPAQVSDGLGRTLTFTYSGTSLASVKDQSGRSASFTYDGVTLSTWTDANGKQTSFAYTYVTNPSLMTAETRPGGNSPYTQVYDASSRVFSQSDSFGNTMTLSYPTGSGGTALSETAGVSLTATSDANLNVSSVSDPSGGISKYTYDANNRPVTTTDRNGNTTRATWDPASGLPASYTDELGNTTSFTYSASTVGSFTFYDVAGVHLADGSTVSIARDSKGNVTSLTDQAGNTWQSTYTANGLPATLTNPAGGVYTFAYNSNGTQASVQLPSSDTTKFAYDNVNRLNLITNPDSTTKSLQYDAVTNLLKATDERNNSLSGTYDANNNVKTSTDSLAATTTFAFDADDRHTSTTDPLGKAVTAVWDTQSRLKSVTNAAGNSLAWTYDKLNRVTAIADASGNGFTYGLDGENRPTSITDALARVTNYTRDAHGNVTVMATPKKENFTYSFDALNWLASAADPLGRSIQYTRDPRGILTAAVLPGGVGASFGLNALGLATSVTDPVGNVWNRSFDGLSRLTSATDPLNRKTSLAYDSRQRISTITLPNGTAQYSYDAAGNVTALKYSDGTNLTYTWDANNRLTAGNGLSLGYDADGRMTTSNGLQITRDAAGRVASVTYASGKTVTYTYNNRGLLSQVSDWVGGNTTFTYDVAGQLTVMALANGTTQTNTWDADGRLASLNVAKGGTTLAAVTLTRDALGRVTSAARSSANIPAEVKGVLPLAYDGASQLLGATFDALGRDTADTARTYVWDLASRLTSYTGSDGSASFTYDAQGQRLSRTSGGVTQNYVWNYAIPLPCISTVQSGGADQTYYVWLPDGTLLNSISAADSSRRFYHFDESGSAMLLTDSNGTVTDTYAISIYGDTVTQTGSTSNPFTWQGKFGIMREGSTSMYYMRARYYDSGPARFLSRDPLPSSDPREINPYQFVRANPVEHGDQTGMGDDSADPYYFHNVTSLEYPQAFHDLSFIYAPKPTPPPVGGGGTTLTFTGANGGAALVHVPWSGIGFPPVGGGGGVGTNPPAPKSKPGSFTAVTTNSLLSSVQTNLLFPFVTNQLGFDTGLAISNTSTDPFGTAAQCGTCTLNFYQSGVSGATNPTSVTAPNLTEGANQPYLAGESYAFTLTQALGVNSANPATFQGYIIAQCNFNYAHGFGYILGGLQPGQFVNPTNTAMGYLSIVLNQGQVGSINSSGN